MPCCTISFWARSIERAYVDEFVYNYGEWHRGWRKICGAARAASGTDQRYFDYPMLKRIAERARAVVVHNPAAARMVREHAPERRGGRDPAPVRSAAAAGRVRSDPHAAKPGRSDGRVPVRRLRLPARIQAPDQRCSGVRGSCAGSIRARALLVAGAFVSCDLERAVAPLLAAPGIVRLPYLAERDFWLAACAVDACINLRHPAAGETSGIAIRLMGIGKPVLLTDGEENARFPEEPACASRPAWRNDDSLRAAHDSA